MKWNFLGLIAICLILVSCGAKKRTSDKAILKNATSNKVLRHYNRTQPHFETINARLRGSYNDGYEEQSIGVSLRMKKDEVIWISATFAGLIPVAKLMVTPDRVQFYEKINNQFFDGDFSLLSKWLGTEVDFEKLQNLLIGKAIYDPQKKEFHLADLDKGYLLNAQIPPVNESLLIDKNTFRILSQQLISLEENKAVSVFYPEYSRINYFFFPKKINIAVKKNSEEAEINIDFRSFEINQAVKFPFEMPVGYKEIHLR